MAISDTFPADTASAPDRLFPLQAFNLLLPVIQPNYEPSPARPVYFEKDVQLLRVAEGYYCLNHALRQQQIYGGEILKDAFDAINEGRDLGPYQPLLKAFRDEGFVVDDYARIAQAKEALIAEELQRGDQERPNFRLLRILLTDVCNLACTYCKVIYNVKGGVNKAPTKSDRLDDVIRFFFENSEERAPKIIQITGGEATLFKGKISDILESRRRYSRPDENCWVILATNATLITPEDAAMLAAERVKCIVSMDGPEDVHDTLRGHRNGKGSWKKVDAGVRLLKEAGVEVSISMVIGMHNVARAEEIIGWILDTYKPTGLGVNFMKAPTPEMTSFEYQISPRDYATALYGVHQRFRDRGVFLELPFRKIDPFVERYYRFHDCGAAEGANLNVDSNGNIGPCKSFLVRKELALPALDAEAYGQTVVKKWLKRSPVFAAACDGCCARGMCGNGCAYEAKFKNGDEMGIDRGACEYTQHFNHLMIQDVARMVKPEGFDRNWWHIVRPEERRRVAGNVRAIEDTLSYSVGHPRFARGSALAQA
jgi:uncharacterized protein